MVQRHLNHRDQTLPRGSNRITVRELVAVSGVQRSTKGHCGRCGISPRCRACRQGFESGKGCVARSVAGLFGALSLALIKHKDVCWNSAVN
jgi:hypothetical protein